MALPRVREQFSTKIHTGDVLFTTKTASYTILDDDEVILADGTSAAVDVTLPPVADMVSRSYTIIRIDSPGNVVRVLPDSTGSPTISGAAEYALVMQWEAVSIISDGSNYYVV